jgi:hypothetical protein
MNWKGIGGRSGLCEVLGSQGGEYEDDSFLEYSAM